MAELIPPRRDETLTGDGIPTLRFSEYLEGLARNVNASTSESELVDVAASPAQLAAIIKRLNDLELQQEPQSTAAVNAAIKSTFDRRYALLVS